MTTFSQQLQAVQDAAFLVISAALKANNGNLVFATKEEAYSEKHEELREDFSNVYPLLTIDTQYGDNEDVYPLSLVGTDHNCTLNYIDERGNDDSVDLLAVDLLTACVLADFIPNHLKSITQ